MLLHYTATTETKKKAKKQIVVGLLCDVKGEPVSVEVFEGTTRDFSTVKNQIEKLSSEFGCKRVTHLRHFSA
ncbi:MAG: hypothetical protein ACP5FO_06835, partial [Desulfurella sp.]